MDSRAFSGREQRSGRNRKSSEVVKNANSRSGLVSMIFRRCSYSVSKAHYTMMLIAMVMQKEKGNEREEEKRWFS